MFDMEIHISEESMKELLYDLAHPSLEDAISRKNMMVEIRRHMKIFENGNQTIVHYDNLDLSFLDEFERND